MLSLLTLLALQAAAPAAPSTNADTTPPPARSEAAAPPSVREWRELRPLAPPAALFAGAEPRGRHTQGGWRFAAVFGDSADHTQHSIMNVLVASGVVLAVLWTLPADMNRFETPVPSFSQFLEAYTKPPLLTDGDWWVWNWIGHPYVGKQQYLMERNWGASQRHAFLFSTAASVLWEYGFEAAFERPSVQDILLTGPAGWVIGEPIHRLTQRMRRNGFSTTEKIIVVIINPLYVLQHGFR
jgi:hypothetical protein